MDPDYYCVKDPKKPWVKRRQVKLREDLKHLFWYRKYAEHAEYVENLEDAAYRQTGGRQDESLEMMYGERICRYDDYLDTDRKGRICGYHSCEDQDLFDHIRKVHGFDAAPFEFMNNWLDRREFTEFEMRVIDDFYMKLLKKTLFWISPQDQQHIAKNGNSGLACDVQSPEIPEGALDQAPKIMHYWIEY